ncbi:hypothetical protein MMC20_004344 [Loxospora ochrophaea]|nr:hypothetical protein [Loxospora ochrophaea]
MAGLIAMTAVLVVVGVEMSFATRGAGHIHGSEYGNVPVEDGSCPERRRHPSNGHAKHSRTRSHSFRSFRQEEFGVHENNSAGLSRASDESIVWAKSPTQANGSSKPSGASYPDSDPEANGSDLNLDEDDPIADSSGLLRIPHSSHDDLGPHSTEQSQEKLLLQCLLLEAGILFHSIFIGMALSVAIGTPFVVLLIAISFHQTFEGLALGSRIAAITIFPPSSPKPWLMALAYGTTTPIGQAIGLAVHGLYDPAGQTGLLMVGATNAVSSGLLLFAGLVELLAEDFLSDASYETLKGKRRLQACGAVVGGALLMALVGAWA